MSIYKEIKNTGIDLFCSYHPKVIQLKREAKTLYKELKSQGLSLMQCQELVAKKNGFTNWYNFIHLIKKHYQQDLDKIPFIITSEKIPPKKDKTYTGHPRSASTYLRDENDKPILFGYDINFGHYKWQNDSSMKTHQLILGQSIYNKYDVYIAKQAIENNRSIIFFNGDGDNQTLHSLVQSATQANRLSDIKIINFTQGSLYPNHEYKIKDNFLGSSGSLTELFYDLLDLKEDYLRGQAVSLIASVMMYLVYKRDSDAINITLSSVKEHFSLEKIKTIVQEKLPKHIQDSIRNYLKFLTLESADEKHQFLSNNIIESLDKLIATQMFSRDENALDLNNMLDKSKTNIFIIQMSSHDKISKTLLLLLKNNIAQLLGVSLDITAEELAAKRKFNSEVLYIFIRSCHTPKGIAVIPAQARSLGLSLTLSYPSIKEFECYSDKENAQSAIANTNTKIFSAIQEDEQTFQLLNRIKDEVSQKSILDISNKDISISIKPTQKKLDYVWLIKGGHASQVSFEAPYEDTIASFNVKIKMKIEDPKETYKLFEKKSYE